MTADLSNRFNFTISYSKIPTTQAEKALVKLPPIGTIHVTQDNEILH